MSQMACGSGIDRYRSSLHGGKMAVVKTILMFLAAHWKEISVGAVLVGRTVAPLEPSVVEWTKRNLPRLAHACHAVDLFVKHCPNLRPVGVALFKVVTGESWEEATGAAGTP